MNGYIRVASATPKLLLGDCDYNALEMIDIVEKAKKEEIKIIVFPELSITGYSCEDLFFQSLILEDSEKAIIKIKKSCENIDMLIVVGVPIKIDNLLFNCAAHIYKGKVISITPKTYLPNNNEFMEKRWFSTCRNLIKKEINYANDIVPIGTDILINCSNFNNLIVATEICQDVWEPIPPSTYHALNGANLILNLSASSEFTGKYDVRKNLMSAHSNRMKCGYIYSSSGMYESSGDIVFSGHDVIFENGTVLEESEMFLKDSSFIFNDIDIDYLNNSRIIDNDSYMESLNVNTKYRFIDIDLKDDTKGLKREISKYPFLPSKDEKYSIDCNHMFTIQYTALARRILQTNSECCIIGISGGLDSTLALLVTVKAFDFLGKDRKNIIGITMPCFGTTSRTYSNAKKLMHDLSITTKEINIKESCLKHFEDINYDINEHNVVYENAQARERTQILMDIANMKNGIVVGTGDMSELALGFTTYNGDHMSMYSVNSGVPKTLVRELISWFINYNSSDKKINETLKDIMDTPVSPELLPPSQKGEINQKTEEIIGPYVLNDFYLYNMVYCGYSPKKIIYLAENAFKDIYTKEELISRLREFYKRFFTQQFKRRCVPDGPKVTMLSLSPRSNLHLPADSSYNAWLRQLDEE